MSEKSPLRQSVDKNQELRNQVVRADRENNGAQKEVDDAMLWAKYRQKDMRMDESRDNPYDVHEVHRERIAGVAKDLAEAVFRKADVELKVHEAETEAKSHYQANKDLLHEAAILDAHLDGVAINVEQPIVVGQEIPVRVETQN